MSGPSIGINLGPPGIYNDNFIFLDLTKQATSWFLGKASNWYQAPTNSNPMLDANGWIKSLAVVDGEKTVAGQRVFFSDEAKPGKFIITWTGDGTIKTDNTVLATGDHRLEVQFDGNPGDGLSYFIQSTDPQNTGNYIKDIKVFRAEHEELIQQGEIFNPSWLSKVDDFRVLRMMDWQETNFTKVTTFSQASDIDGAYFTYGDTKSGVSIETMVRACNETKADLWINIPTKATNDYVKQTAEYIATNLDPSLKVYVEYANEWWTPIFDQNAYFKQKAAALGIGDKLFAEGQVYAMRAAEVSKIFEANFGTNASERVLSTLTSFKSGPGYGTLDYMLNAPDLVALGMVAPKNIASFDVLAVDGYFGFEAGTSAMQAMINQWRQSPDDGIGAAVAFLRRQINGEVKADFKTARDAANAAGLTLAVYEGGSALTAFGDSGNKSLSDWLTKLSNSPQMKAAYADLMAAWKLYGNDVFAHFSDIARPGWYGAWGLYTSSNDDAQLTPRGEIVLDYNESNPANWIADPRPASVFANGEYRLGTATADSLAGGTKADRLYGSAGNDTLFGKGGDDQLVGGTGNDVLNGDAGNDFMNGGVGKDTLNGGTGIDTASYAQSKIGVMISLTTGVATNGDAQGDKLFSIENLIGSRLKDVLTGSAENNRLEGGDGDDGLTGLAGNDVLIGGAGNDSLFGGIGNDWLTGGSGNDLIDGGTGLDKAYFIGTVSVMVNLGVIVAQVTGLGTDILAGIEQLVSGSGNDRLTGNSMANSLRAGAGNDTLDGAAGADLLNGGAGTDRLTGGGGADSFEFSTSLGPANIDTIVGFGIADDTIRLENAVFTGLAAGVLAPLAYASNAAGDATDTSDRIIYEKGSGNLYFDPDGSGVTASILFAKLPAGLQLSNADFFVF